MTTHWRCGIVPLLIVFVDLYSRLLTMMSIVPPSNAFLLVLTRFATFYYEFVSEATYIQLEGVDSAGASWRLYSIRMDWNGSNDDQGCLVGGTTVGGRTATCVRLLQRCAWLQQADHLHYVTMQVKIGFSFFPSYFGLWLCGDGKSMLPGVM